jgi:hypothetical protein
MARWMGEGEAGGERHGGWEEVRPVGNGLRWRCGGKGRATTKRSKR